MHDWGLGTVSCWQRTLAMLGIAFVLAYEQEAVKFAKAKV